MSKIITIFMVIIIITVSNCTNLQKYNRQRILQTTCPTNCLTCSSPNICSACIKGYWLQFSNICTKCPINCLTCTNSTTCTYCASSTYLNVNTTTGQKLCSSCIQNCLNCNNSNSCTTCRSGYVAEGSVCQREPYVWWIIVLSAIDGIFLILVIIVLINNFKAKGMKIPETFFKLQQGTKRY